MAERKTVKTILRGIVFGYRSDVARDGLSYAEGSTRAYAEAIEQAALRAAEAKLVLLRILARLDADVYTNTPAPGARTLELVKMLEPLVERVLRDVAMSHNNLANETRWRDRARRNFDQVKAQLTPSERAAVIGCLLAHGNGAVAPADPDFDAWVDILNRDPVLLSDWEGVAIKERETGNHWRKMFGQMRAGYDRHLAIKRDQRNIISGLVRERDALREQVVRLAADQPKDGEVEEAGVVNVAIVGSRDFGMEATGPRSDTRVVGDMVAHLKRKHGDALAIVSGGARGVDTLAEMTADMLGVRKVIHLPDWDRHGKGAGLRRNTQIVADADMVVAFYANGPRSWGTTDTVTKAREAGKPVHVWHEGAWA